MKLKCVIYAPVDTSSGYGARSRDLVKSIINLKKEEWDIRIIPCNWGNTAHGFTDNPEWSYLKELFIPQLQYQPDIWIMITVPNEFKRVGKYNIGITAGIETTICDPSWVEGINQMDLTLVSSEHAKKVFQEVNFDKVDQRTNQKVSSIKVEKPVEVLFEGANLDVFKILDKEEEYTKESLVSTLYNIPENFCYLFVGHWMQGNMGEDRKNVGLLVKSFYETFKNKKKKPALILKTSGANCSYGDRDQILQKIYQIKGSVNSDDLPNIYLINGELSDAEINELYNHPKVKAMVSLTKGEGFGRPLLEFSLIKKPIICSGWSGQLDFLKPEFTNLIPGTLTEVHETAAVPNILLREAKWFTPSSAHIGQYLKDVFEKYHEYTERAKRQAFFSKTNFSFEKMQEKLDNLLTTYLPDFPKPIKLKLPQLGKISMPKRVEV